MANLCGNWVSISGDEEQVKKFVEIVGEEFDFNGIIPTESTSREEATEKWGCNTMPIGVYFEDESDFGIAHWTFSTNWAPPVEIYKYLLRKFPQVFIYWRYEEPGNGVYGYLNNGDF
jgi:hypothetical protein